MTSARRVLEPVLVAATTFVLVTALFGPVDADNPGDAVQGSPGDTPLALVDGVIWPLADPPAVSAVENVEQADPIDFENAPVGSPENASHVGQTSAVEAVTQVSAGWGADVQPISVRIPGIDVNASMIDLGLNGDGTLEVPSDFGLTGWFTGRSVPGEHGPSVVVGHVDSWAGPAVFFRLRELEPGDAIAIDRSDGLVAWFRVREVVLVDKGEFPTEQVYGSTNAPELRLITCGGDFDRSVRSYEGNVIVFADHLFNAAVVDRML